MQIGRLDHFTLRVEPGALPALCSFYVEVLGLREGERPDFAFPGHWLYADGKAVVHLAGLGRADASAGATGRLDHISMAASGLETTRAHLGRLGVKWREAPVPGTALHQIFLHDPCGLMLELTFDLAAEQVADTRAAPP